MESSDSNIKTPIHISQSKFLLYAKKFETHHNNYTHVEHNIET